MLEDGEKSLLRQRKGRRAYFFFDLGMVIKIGGRSGLRGRLYFLVQAYMDIQRGVLSFCCIQFQHCNYVHLVT